jgi:TonB family protein
MAFTKMRLIGLVLSAVSIGLPLTGLGQNQDSNNISLGQLARQLNEQRASKGLAPVRVFTNEDLPARPTPNGSEDKRSALGAEKAGDHPATPSSDDVDFRPAEAASVTDITKPALIFGYGQVVLDVLISDTGEVKDVEVRRDPGSLTDVAVGSVRSWKFQPAQDHGKAVASRVTVAVNFNADSYLVSGEADLPLPPLIHQSDEARIQSAFQPPEVTRATLPPFPYGALQNGTVILQAIVNEEGKVEHTAVLRDSAPFEPTALRAVAGWRFLPATLNGAPMKSAVVLAFVFTAPIDTN